MRNDFFGEMAETGGVPLNASPVRRWAGVFGHRPFAFSISMGVKTSDGMNWNLQDLVYEALSEEWRKRDGEISDPWANDEADGYQPPSYEPVNPERRTAQTPRKPLREKLCGRALPEGFSGRLGAVWRWSWSVMEVSLCCPLVLDLR